MSRQVHFETFLDGKVEESSSYKIQPEVRGHKEDQENSMKAMVVVSTTSWEGDNKKSQMTFLSTDQAKQLLLDLAQGINDAT